MKPNAPAQRTLTAKQKLFKKEYAKDGNAEAAALRAGYARASEGRRLATMLSTVKGVSSVEPAKAAEKKNTGKKSGTKGKSKPGNRPAVEKDSGPLPVCSVENTSGCADPENCFSGHSARARMSENITFDEEAAKRRILEELAAVGFSAASDLCEWGEEGVTLVNSGRLTRRQAAAVAEVVESSGRSGVRIKLHAKLKALEMLGRLLGMFDSDAAGRPSDIPQAGSSDADFTERLRALFPEDAESEDED